jgi:hypothetical protein
MFGSGAETKLVVGSGFPTGSVVIVPADLGVVGGGPTATFGRDTRSGAFTATVLLDEEGAPNLVPFAGSLPGVEGMPDAFAFAGRLVRPATDPDDASVLALARDIALLPGVEPSGTVGPDGRWMVFRAASVSFPVSRSGWISPGVVPILLSREPAAIRLVDAATVLEVEADGGHLAPTFHGVAPDAERAAVLVVGNEAAEAEVFGPEGTVVWWSSRGTSGRGTIGPMGSVRIQLLPPAGPNAPDGSGATSHIWAVTPAGHAYSGIWRIRVYRQPPGLAIAEDAPLLDFDPSLAGQTIPGATVTVNGEPVDVADDGRFEAAVQVGLIPTELRVVATDPVGNETLRVVSRVWPLDYRQLPFIPIAVLLTVAAAALLYLRRPESGPDRRRPDEEATFEEIGG